MLWGLHAAEDIREQGWRRQLVCGLALGNEPGQAVSPRALSLLVPLDVTEAHPLEGRGAGVDGVGAQQLQERDALRNAILNPPKSGGGGGKKKKGKKKK